MAGRWTKDFSFVGGAPLAPEWICFALLSDEMAKKKKEFTLLSEWNKGKWKAGDHWLASSAVGIASKPGAKATCLILGYWGEILCFDGEKSSIEAISDVSPPNPEAPGPMRGISFIGDSFFAVGMGREVYQRDTQGRWRAIDKGVRVTGSSDDVLGFNAIHGFSTSDIYAAGWGGEIWNYNGRKWTAEKSPTNLTLNAICCAPGGVVSIAGKMGTLIRGRHGRWATIDHDATDEEFFSAEWYQERLYLATSAKLYVFHDDVLEPVDFEDVGAASCLQLFKSNEYLWSVGPKDILRFDGRRWERID